jgi:hypothetical protein
LAREQLGGDGILDVLGPSIVADIDHSIREDLRLGTDDPEVIARNVVKAVRFRQRSPVTGGV